MAIPPTFDGPSDLRTNAPAPSTPLTPEKEAEIVQILEGYRLEAEDNRRGGLNPRDDKWTENLNLYWNRKDFTEKARWQAKETMPEVPQYVDRFAAAMKEALTTQDFYTIVDPADTDHDLTKSIKRMMDVWLTRTGRNQMGQLLPFSSTFEEQMKLGAIMATSSVVTWKEDVDFGRVAIETVDPQMVWIDHTYRNLYRRRRIELDKHDLKKMAKQKDSMGEPIFNLANLNALVGSTLDEQVKREELTGTGQQISSTRQPIVLDEYIATVVDKDGVEIADRGLFVVGNNKFLIRGPEPNPFWHGQDWLVFAPLITAPQSVYGRAYMEDFGSVASTFTELTNLLLDAVHTSSMKVWSMVPGALLNPAQVTTGIVPNKLFLLEDGIDPDKFLKSLDMGTMSADGLRMWQEMKRELSEAAGINEIGLGQFAPKGRTSATEVVETKASSSALIRSVAQTVELRYLDLTLDLTWKTGLQHVRPNDQMLINAAGAEMFRALYDRRRELIKRPMTFQARGISALIANSQKLKALIGLLQLVGSSEVMMKEFLRVVDMSRFLNMLFELSNIDVTKLQATERERLTRMVTEPMGEAANRVEGAPSAGPAAQGAVGSAMRSVGL